MTDKTLWAASQDRYRHLTGTAHALDPITRDPLCGLKPHGLRPANDPTDLNRTSRCRRCLAALGEAP